MDKLSILKAISLVLAILFFLGFVSLQAFAAEEEIPYQDTNMVEGTDGGTHPPSGGSESELDFPDGEIPPEEWITFLEDVSAIRRDTELFIYFVIPFSWAILILYKSYRWFCSTFIESVL